jgi:hypothetical protein
MMLSYGWRNPDCWPEEYFLSHEDTPQEDLEVPV